MPTYTRQQLKPLSTRLGKTYRETLKVCEVANRYRDKIRSGEQSDKELEELSLMEVWVWSFPKNDCGVEIHLAPSGSTQKVKVPPPPEKVSGADLRKIASTLGINHVEAVEFCREAHRIAKCLRNGSECRSDMAIFRDRYDVKIGNKEIGPVWRSDMNSDPWLREYDRKHICKIPQV